MFCNVQKCPFAISESKWHRTYIVVVTNKIGRLLKKNMHVTIIDTHRTQFIFDACRFFLKISFS